MNGSLGEHGVVLQLGLAEGRGVGGDDDQLGLAGLWGISAICSSDTITLSASRRCVKTHTEGLDGGLVAEGDWNNR